MCLNYDFHYLLQLPKLESFIWKTFVKNDLDFAYLKWILNNLNHIRKLKIHLKNDSLYGTHKTIWKSLIDANFIRRYCLPDKVINLTYFDFYISSKCELQMNNISEITNSFKIHPFFIDHQWTNVNYFFDPIHSYQHLTSSLIYKPRFFNNIL